MRSRGMGLACIMYAIMDSTSKFAYLFPQSRFYLPLKTDSPRMVVRLHPLQILAAGHFLPPCLVVEIPSHRLAQARREGFLRLPAQFALGFGCVNGVAAVVAW